MSTRLFERVALIGFGLIGSSLARVLRRDSPQTVIVACARSAETLETVRRLGLADETSADPASAVVGADLVVIATPLSAYGEIGRRIAPALREGAIVTDVGSVKGAAIAALQPELPSRVHFVPAHPVAGTEHSGPEAGFDLDRALATLPPGARSVFVLHDVEGYKHREIAAMLAIASGTSKRQLHRARMLLRGYLGGPTRGSGPTDD